MFLPKLVDNSTIRFNVKGTFSAIQGNVVLPSALIKEIAISRTDSKNPRSIPAVYEQPIKYHTYLNNASDWPNVTTNMIQDWRALITLIALSEMNGYGIHFTKVDFNDAIELYKCKHSLEASGKEENDQYSLKDISTELAAYNGFEKICARALPMNRNNGFKNTDWRTSFAIVYKYDENDAFDKDKVIGMCSPYTIVCPSDSEDFRKCINKEKFKFVEYDDDFKNEVEKQGSVFNDICNEKLRSQFDNFTKTELKAVLEWIRQTKQFCDQPNANSQTVGYKLLNDFEKFLLNIYTDDVFRKTWTYIGSRFKKDPFLPSGDVLPSGFNEINLSAKRVTLQREWNALFCLLALKEEKGINLRFKDKYVEVKKSGDYVPVAHESTYTLVEPIVNIASVVGLEFTEIAEKDEYDYVSSLSAFERMCVIQWLARLLQNEKVKNTEQIKEYVDVFKASLEKMTLSDDELEHFSLWEDNRFIDNTSSGGPLDCFNFCVDYNVAAFYEDYRGKGNDKIYGEDNKRARGIWFSLLETLMLRKVNNVKVEFQEIEGTSSDSSLLYASGKYVKYAIRINDVISGYTSRAMLFTVNNTTEIANVKRCESEFEQMILATRLNELLNGLRSEAKYINSNHKDFKTIEKYINEKIDEIKPVVYKNNKQRFDRDAGTINIYFPLTEDEEINKFQSTARFLHSYVSDKFFADKLLVTQDTAKINMEVTNTDADQIETSVYAIRVLDPDGNEMGVDGNTNENGSIFIPISDDAAANLFKRIQESPQNRQGIKRYGFEFIKAYKYDDADDITVEINLNDIMIPFVKKYDEDSIITDWRIRDLPDLLVWPNIDIQDWNTYYFTTARINANDNHRVTIELPERVYGTVNKKGNNFNDGKGINLEFPTAERNKEANDTINIMTECVAVFPYMVRISMEGGYGYLFTPSFSNASGSKKQYLTKSGDSTIIGIDFGTTNTTAWLFDGENGQFDARLADSASIIRAYVNDQRLTKTAHYIVAQKSSMETNSVGIDAIINSVFIKYNQDRRATLEHPFIHANIFRLTGRELTVKDGLLDSKNLRFDMKWTENKADEDEIRTFLLQYTLMCCKAAIEMRGITSVEIRASFPSSMSQRKRLKFEDIWNKQIVGGLKSMTGLDIINGDIKFYTESYCAGVVPIFGKVIVDSPASLSNGYICIDIGGGSTDISVFYKNQQPTAEMSIPFAGQLFLSGNGYKDSRDEIVGFLKTLRKKIETEFNRFERHQKNHLAEYENKVSDYENVLKRMASCSDDDEGYKQFKLLTDIVVTGLYESFNKIKTIGGFTTAGFSMDSTFATLLRRTRDEQSSHYLAKIKFGLSALAYFIGLALKKFESEGKFKLVPDSYGESFSLKIYFAGNGSRILDWYMPNAEDRAIFKNLNLSENDEKAGRAVLAEYIKRGYGIKSDQKFKIDVVTSKSERVKLEAAFGLTKVSGASQIFDEENLDSLAPIGIDRCLEEMSLKEFEKHLKSCLEKLKPEKNDLDAGKIKMLFETGDKGAIRSAVTNVINPGFEVHGGDGKNIIAQPIFDFLVAFMSVSEKDWESLFKNVNIDPDVPLKHSKNTAVREKIGETANMIIKAINNPDTERTTMPIRDFTPYAILEYAMLVLDGRAGL